MAGERGQRSRGGRPASERTERGATRDRAARAYSRAAMEARYSRHDAQRHDVQRHASARESYDGRGGSGSRRASGRNTPSGVRNSTYSRRAPADAVKPVSRRRQIAVLVVAVLALVALVAFAGRALVLGKATAPETADNDIVGVNGTTEAQPNLPTPIMAKSKGVYLHCAVSMDDLTEILIHNASYDYACPITTKLSEATNVDVMAAHGTGRDKAGQPTGDEWMTGEFIRTFRSTNAGPRMSAIDCGAPAGSQVYAPVSGTVLLVKQYKLYEKYDDYIVHIQPEGKPNLDVCMIHLTDPTVQAGDQVTAGVTPVAKVRDVYALIGEEMQLKDYTAEGDNGNHTHIQVNNAKAKDYHGLDDLKKASSSSSSGGSSDS